MAKYIDNLIVEAKLERKIDRFEPSIQNTAASTKTLTLDSESIQIFNGTIAGQILRLPNATTLQNGHSYELWNFSNKEIAIQDAGSNNLTDIRPNGRTQILLRDNTTSNGIWGLTYTLDTGNVFGGEIQYVEDVAETSTSSTAVYSTKLTITTPASLPLGDYLVSFQFIWRSSAANREADFRFQLNGVTQTEWSPSTGRTQDRQLLSGFFRLLNISGTNTVTFQFKKNPATASTIFVRDAKMFIWRIA